MGANQNANRGLVSTLVHGAKDIPRNASWLAAKAVPHERHTTDDGASNGTNGTSPDLKGLAQRAGRAVREAMPGTDTSVELGLARARESADAAREAEDRALSAAERAHTLRVRADEVSAEEDQHIQEVEAEQRAEVERRVAAAMREAEDHLKAVRRDADADAERVHSQEREASEARATQARAEAEQAQEEAQQRYAEATERLALARTRAEEAATLAQQAADEAKETAQRISAQVRQDQKQAQQAVSQANGLRERTEKEAAMVTRTIRRTEPRVLADMSESISCTSPPSMRSPAARRCRRSSCSRRWSRSSEVRARGPSDARREGRESREGGQAGEGDEGDARDARDAADAGDQGEGGGRRRWRPPDTLGARPDPTLGCGSRRGRRRAVSGERARQRRPASDGVGVRLRALGVLAIGYVLGTRAGRERYEQIRRLASEAAGRLETYGERGTLAARLEREPSRGGTGTGRS